MIKYRVVWRRGETKPTIRSHWTSKVEDVKTWLKFAKNSFLAHTIERREF